MTDRQEMAPPVRRRAIFACLSDDAGGCVGDGTMAKGRGRRELAATTALALPLGLWLVAGMANLARAAPPLRNGGGTGGSDSAGNPGGAGGAFGGAGSPGMANSGGGGGGAGGEPGGLGAGNGGSGGSGGANGNGAGTATLNNTGMMTGTDGTAGTDALPGGGGGGGGAGGYGAVVTGSGGSNSGTINGGNGSKGGRGSNGGQGNNGGNGGDGGDGVSIVGPGATFTNTGRITGGDGSFGGASYNFGTVYGANYGIIGGNGGNAGAGGAGIMFAGQAVTFTNTGIVTGGNGGDNSSGGMPTNYGSFYGVNYGTVSGNGGNGGGGGAGAVFVGQAATFHNLNSVTGGNGGAGAVARNTGSIYDNNDGTVSGKGGNGGDGGAGVVFANQAATFTNSSAVTGGNGGDGGSASNTGSFRANNNTVSGNGGNGGDGGEGIVFAGGGGTFINSGTVTGGNGGQYGTGQGGGSNGTFGAGGVGVTGIGLTVTNAGTISGGLAGDGVTQAAAVTFTGGVNSLTITSTSNFVGTVSAYSAADTFGLGGPGNASFNLAQLGAAGSSALYQGFGILQKSGTSTWTLAGTPGVPLAYQITAGTLDLGGATRTATSLQITGGTLANGTLASGGTFDVQAGTISANLAGTGALTKTTSGTAILTGANTYTGATTISGGTLLGGAANVFSATSATSVAKDGTLDLGGFAQTINAVALTGGTLRNGALTGAVTSTGGKIDGLGGAASVTTTAGTTIATGTNTYTGGTMISGGTLQLGDGGTTGSITGNVTNNANLAFHRSDTYQFDGIISGSGNVEQNGTGKTKLTGANIYTGATSITAGTLEGHAANVFSATSATSVAKDGTLDLGGFAQTINAVALTGGTLRNGTLTGAVTSTGGKIDGLGGAASVTTTAGTTIATGTNTYTGGTMISGGTLQLGDGGTTGSITGNVTNNANLAFNRSDTYQFDGIISGSGNVQQNGTGTTILTAANTYTGATTINAGTLQVDGSIASPNVTVNKHGTLSGIGKIGDPQINAGGTLAPGNAANPTGTLTIVGPLGFAARSFYNVLITPTANSHTNVVGTTTISGGKVRVLAGSGTYATNTRYTILTSTGGVAGTFKRAKASKSFAFLKPTLSYDANDVYLYIRPSNPTPQGTPDYRTAAVTQNQYNVAAGLTNAGAAHPGGNGDRIVTALNQLTAPQARAAFDSVSGEGLTAAQNIANRSAELFTSSIFDQTTFYGSGNAANAITLTEPIRELADLPSGKVQPPVFVQPNRTWRAWATGFGGVDDIHGNGQIGSSYQQNTIYGGTLGVDYQLMPNYLVGVAIGGTNGDFLVPGRATSGSTTGGHVAFYDLATFGSFYGASSTSFSYFGNRATRTVSGFGGLGTETERANFNSNEFRTRLEFGRHLAGYGGVLTPFVALELAQLRSNGFTENAVQGAGLFRLNVSGQSQASAPAFVGLRLQRATSLGNGITLSPTLQVAYVHEFAAYRSEIGTLADLPGSTFLVDGARPARNAAQVKAGAEMAIGARSMIFANFDGEFSGVNQLYAGKGGFRYMW